MHRREVTESRRMVRADTEARLQSHSRAEFPNKSVRNYGRLRYHSRRYVGIWQRGCFCNKSGGTAVNKNVYRPEIPLGISGLFACIYERCESPRASGTKRCLHRIWTACTRTFIARQRDTKQKRSVCEWHREGGKLSLRNIF